MEPSPKRTFTEFSAPEIDAPTTAQPCFSCQQKLSSTICKTCDSAPQYCSALCRASNSVLHRLLCAPYWTPMRPPRPPYSTLGLFIPTSGPPTFRFVKYYDDDCDIVRPDVLSLLGTDNFTRTLLSWNAFEQKELTYTLQLLQAPGKQKINSFIHALTEETGYTRYWGGPMVILAHEHMEYSLDELIWRDVGCEDLRWMFDYWRFGDEPLEKGLIVEEREDAMQCVQTRGGQMQLSIRTRTVKGVVIACEAERKLVGSTYIEVDIGPEHPIWRESPTQLSVKMELPLLMHAFRVQLVADGIPDSMYSNPEASALSRIVDIEDPGWGLVADEGYGNIGSVLVVRVDKKDIDAKQVDTLSAFCAKILGRAMCRVKEGKSERSKEEVTDEVIDKEIFNVYFKERRWVLGAEDVSWRQAQDPYYV